MRTLAGEQADGDREGFVSRDSEAGEDDPVVVDRRGRRRWESEGGHV